MFLKQSTSAVVLVGPVLDASGVAVTTAVIGDFTLTKNGTSATMSGNTISHSHNGHYAITLTAANTDTIGRLTISVNNTAQAMPVFRWDICQPTVYDALFTNAVNTSGGLPAATGAISALSGAVSTYAGGAVASVTGNVGGDVVGSVGSISGVTFPTHFDNLDIAANGHVTATVDAINNNAITANSIQANAITSAKIATDAIGAAQLAADAVTEIQSGLATAENLLIANDRIAYALTALVGACSDAQTAAETYTLSINGSTFTVDYSGLDASGNRGTTTLTKA